MKRLKEYMTVSETARKWDCSRSYVHHLILQKRVPGVVYVGEDKPIYLIPSKCRMSDISDVWSDVNRCQKQ